MNDKADSSENVVNLKTPAEEAPARRKGIYLLPNLLTTGALFGGFYAVLSGFSVTMNGLRWRFLLRCCLMASMVVWHA